MKRLHQIITAFSLSILMLTLANTNAMAQKDQRKFRIATIEVDPLKMVKSLELVDVAPIAIAIKPNLAGVAGSH